MFTGISTGCLYSDEISINKKIACKTKEKENIINVE
jgi:hypothetical protein